MFTPEELLLEGSGDYTVVAMSSQSDPGELLMSDDQIGRHHQPPQGHS